MLPAIYSYIEAESELFLTILASLVDSLALWPIMHTYERLLHLRNERRLSWHILLCIRKILLKNKECMMNVFRMYDLNQTMQYTSDIET